MLQFRILIQYEKQILFFYSFIFIIISTAILKDINCYNLLGKSHYDLQRVVNFCQILSEQKCKCQLSIDKTFLVSLQPLVVDPDFYVFFL